MRLLSLSPLVELPYNYQMRLRLCAWHSSPRGLWRLLLDTHLSLLCRQQVGALIGHGCTLEDGGPRVICEARTLCGACANQVHQRPQGMVQLAILKEAELGAYRQMNGAAKRLTGAAADLAIAADSGIEHKMSMRPSPRWKPKWTQVVLVYTEADQRIELPFAGLNHGPYLSSGHRSGFHVFSFPSFWRMHQRSTLQVTQ